MEALAQIAQVLGRGRRTKSPSSAASTRPGSFAAAMLEALAAEAAELSSGQLARVAGVEVKQVLGILKHAIAVGKLDYRVDGSRVGWYQLRPEFDEELYTRLNEAASLLRRHGWKVAKP